MHRFRSLLILLFLAYLALLLKLALSPIPEPPYASPAQNWVRTWRNLRWIPFTYLFDPRASPAAIREEVIGNIVATVPFGLLLPMLFHIPKRAFFWISWMPGVFLESTQFGLSLLFGPYRTVDTSDILLNTLGCLVGYGLFLSGKEIINHLYLSTHE